MARTIRVRLLTFGELKGTARDNARAQVEGMSAQDLFDAEFTTAGVLFDTEKYTAQAAVDGSTQEPDVDEDGVVDPAGGPTEDTPDTVSGVTAAGSPDELTSEPNEVDPNEPVTDFSNNARKKRAAAAEKNDTDF